MPSDFLRALIDPTAPLPAGWPSGALGAFVLFLVPVGGGIPLGVLMARDAGVGPLVTALLYLVSDVALAFTTEPLLVFLHWLGRRSAAIARLGDRLGRFTGQVGLQGQGPRGPLGLILLSFTVSPTTGRAGAAAAGHGFVSGWTLAIIGDMGYFALLMASTLWLSSVIGDERVTIGAVLLATWVLPLAIRRLRRGRTAPPRPASAMGLVAPATPVVVGAAAGAGPRPAMARRARRRHGGRR